jgi:hypothetical protein
MNSSASWGQIVMQLSLDTERKRWPHQGTNSVPQEALTNMCLFAQLNYVKFI